MNAPPASSLSVTAPESWSQEAAALARLAGPLVASNLLQMSIAAVDVMFVARLGAVELAAATLAVFLFNLLCYALIGLGSAAAPLIAAELGRKRHAVREVRLSFRMAVWTGLFGSLPIMLLLAHGEWLFLALGQQQDIAHQADRFLLILLPAVPLAAANGVMRTAAAALGRPQWTFLVTGLAFLVDLLANWALVFGHLGLPALSLMGSAIANLLSLGGMSVAYGVILMCDRPLRRYRLFGRWWRLDGNRAWQIVRLGSPIMVTWMLEGGLFGGAALLMGLIGIPEIAAHAIALNIAAFAFQIPFGIGQAATIRVGLAFGAGDRRWIGRAGNTALALGIGVMACTALIMWSTPRLLVGIYIDPAEVGNIAVARLAIRFLAIAAVFQLADGAQAVGAGILRGLQDTRLPMMIALFGYWGVGFVCSILLGFRFHLGGVGIWWGLAAGLLVVAILLGFRWNRRQHLGLLP